MRSGVRGQERKPGRRARKCPSHRAEEGGLWPGLKDQRKAGVLYSREGDKQGTGILTPEPERWARSRGRVGVGVELKDTGPSRREAGGNS